MQGNDAFNKKDYAGAIDLFTRAQSLVHAPPHVLMIARSQVALKRLVAARESYLLIERTQLADNAPSAFKEAQAAAKIELAELSPRVPSIDIKVSNPDAENLVVSIDGKPIPPALVGIRRPIDPGTYILQAHARGFASDETPVTVKEKDRLSLTLDLYRVAGGDDDTFADEEPVPAKGSDGTGMRIAGYSTLGLGAAGLVVGGVFLGLGFGQQGDADTAYDACQAVGCAKESVQGKEVLELDAAASSKQLIGGITAGIGAAVLGTGIVLLVLAPKKSADTNSAHIEPWLGFGSAGVRGAF